jgi:HSP20 family molecular chaperone IbpA
MSSIFSTGSSKNDLSEQYASQQAEREKIRDQHEKEMDRLEQNYANEVEHTRDRYEASLQEEYDRSYENLRNAKRKLSSQERDLEKSGKDRLRSLSESFKNEESHITKEGEHRLHESQKKQALIEEYQRHQALKNQSLSRNDYLKNASMLIEDNERKIENLQNKKSEELEKRKTEHAEALSQIHEHFDQRRNQIIEQNEDRLINTQLKLAEQKNKILQKTAFNVSDTETKIDDPFYRLSRLDSEFTDEGDYYQLRIRVPEHEMKNLKVQVSGQNVQITGSRDHDATAVIDSGHEMSTRSYQTYSERYSMDVPVDPKGMLKTVEDGWIQYSIPKYGPNHPVQSDQPLNRMALSALSEKTENFKETLPTPTVRNDRGSRTTS